MQLTVIGSADDAGIPVHGCLCKLCRQARAVRHLRRRPRTLLLQSQGESLLVDAGTPDLDRRLMQAPVENVLLSDWRPASWHGLLPVHLGSATDTTVFGPLPSPVSHCLSQQDGQLRLAATLQPGQETLAGRFCILPFSLGETSSGEQTTLAYGIRDGEHRLLYLPGRQHYDNEIVATLAAWRADAVVAGCPLMGSPSQRLEQLGQLYAALGQIPMLITAIDHHMDSWLQARQPELPDGIRLAEDGLRLTTSYLAEYRRLSLTASSC